MKAIIFDCFGVLTADVWREFAAALPRVQQKRAGDLNRAYDAGFITRPQFTEQVTDLTGLVPPSIEHSPSPIKNLELLAYIKQLKRDYKIGMLSNIASDWITESFLTADEQALFDDMIFSHHVHLIKPDEAIFELAASRLGFEPQDCLMVDDLARNCDGARRAGMSAVLYENLVQAKSDINKLLSQSGN